MRAKVIELVERVRDLVERVLVERVRDFVERFAHRHHANDDVAFRARNVMTA